MQRGAFVLPRREHEGDFGVFERLSILICVFVTYIKTHGALHFRFMHFNMLSLSKKVKQKIRRMTAFIWQTGLSAYEAAAIQE